MLKIGLIGCGGRGGGAVRNALAADPNSQLTAVGDVFADRVAGTLKSLENELGEKSADRLKVSPDTTFLGFDCYQKVVDSGVDVVLLCSPPAFRPTEIKYAVEKGIHVFAEKPVAVDGPGIRSVIESAKMAKDKGLSLVSGLCYRYDRAKRETFKRIHDGQIGKLLAIHVTYNTSPLSHRNRHDDWDDLTFQLRNWQYFTWLSGDQPCEQHIHSLDKAAWAMHDEPPLSAVALGGRQMLKGEDYGNIFDHNSAVFEYANGVRVFANCCQISGVQPDVTDTFIGTEGICQTEMHRHQIEGANPWRFREKYPSMYQSEHDELFASIRNGKPINNGEYMVRSNVLGIMMREAAYTGKKITWDQVINSQTSLMPEKLAFGPLPVAPVAMPGISTFA